MSIRAVRMLVLSLTLTFLSACASGTDPGTPGAPVLEGISWVLDATSIAAMVPEAPTTARVTILFEGGDAGGSAACNTYGGTYTFAADAGDGLSIEVGQMTEMACDEPLMQLESAYVEALGQVDTFALTSEGLLLTGGTATLTFTEEPSEEALPLTGTTWTLTTIALPGSDVVGNVIAATEITAVFADDGTMTGSGGCNQLNGPYETDDGALTIGPLASTMISCGADIDEQEQAYMATIDAVFSYTIEGSQLTMQDVDGADILVFDGS